MHNCEVKKTLREKNGSNSGALDSFVASEISQNDGVSNGVYEQTKQFISKVNKRFETTGLSTVPKREIIIKIMNK